MRAFRWFPVVVATFLIVPLVVTSGAATASAPPHQLSATEPASLSATERADLAAIATSRGISMDDAVLRFAWQDAFAIAATTIEAAYPDSFSSSEITSEDPAIGTIRFVDDVPAGVEDLLVGVPAHVQVRLVGGEALSAREISQAVADAHQAVIATGAVDGAVTSYDRVSGLVQVAASPRLGSVPPDATRDQLAERARVVQGALPPGLARVELTLVPGLRGTTEARLGGGRLEFSGTSSLACTAGFNVVDSAGTTGVATAGHCSDSLTHENTSGGSEYALTLRGEHRGTWGDFQWHTSSDTEPDDFYYNATSTRDVAARANPSDNQTICRFGHTSGDDCNTVVDTELCATMDGVDTCHLVRMEADTADGGDSGGPWYYSTTAYGFHTGQVGCGFLWQNTCDVWSRVTYIDDALGVTVKTS